MIHYRAGAAAGGDVFQVQVPPCGQLVQVSVIANAALQAGVIIGNNDQIIVPPGATYTLEGNAAFAWKGPFIVQVIATATSAVIMWSDTEIALGGR